MEKNKEKCIIVIGSREEVMAKIKELAGKEEDQLEELRKKAELENVDGIWDHMELKEKMRVLATSGYEL